MSKSNFIFASRQAQLWGHSLYRGKQMSSGALQSARIPTSTSTSSYILSQLCGQTSSRALRQQHHAKCVTIGKRAGQRFRRQIRILSWNCGGLSPVQCDDLRAYLSQNNVDLACLQQTRWSRLDYESAVADTSLLANSFRWTQTRRHNVNGLLLAAGPGVFSWSVTLGALQKPPFLENPTVIFEIITFQDF